MIETLCSAFQRVATDHRDRTALRTPDGGVELTWAQYAARVERLAGGLATLGVRRGDAVALMLSNRPEFAICDSAALHLGAIPFSIYNTYAPEQIAHLLGNAGSRVVVTETTHVATVLAALGTSSVEHVVSVDGAPEGTLTISEVEAAAPSGFEFEQAWRAVSPGDVATLIYTSGTTGPPKGVELTHANLLAQVAATRTALPVSAEDRTISYLPSAHIADRWASHYTQMVVGLEVTFVSDARTIADVLPKVRPTVWGAVPRIWEKLKAGLEAAGIADPAALPESDRAGLRAKLGLDRIRWAASGAAPIPAQVLEYFLALGLPISEALGMSELSGCATINPVDDIRIGTVGKALPGVELKLAQDGELLARGETLMRGYRGEPDKTAEAIVDGWLRTGDLATIDDAGYVRIIDRKKEIIINAAGKNMSPANIEQTVKTASPLIGQAVCIGDGRPYNVALIVLDSENTKGYEKNDPAISTELAAAIERANARLARVEQIKRYHVLESEWEPGGDELTPTMKLRRKQIDTKYHAEIDALYASDT